MIAIIRMENKRPEQDENNKTRGRMAERDAWPFFFVIMHKKILKNKLKQLIIINNVEK